LHVYDQIGAGCQGQNGDIPALPILPDRHDDSVCEDGLAGIVEVRRHRLRLIRGPEDESATARRQDGNDVDHHGLDLRHAVGEPGEAAATRVAALAGERGGCEVAADDVECLRAAGSQAAICGVGGDAGVDDPARIDAGEDQTYQDYLTL
jgi:hypothetical protein